VGEGAVTRGELMHFFEGDEWVPCRVLTAFGEGLSVVLLVVRRLTDGQRLMVLRDGSLLEVSG
jgi:hypothetical protein